MSSRFGFLLFDNFEDLDFFGPWEMFAHWSKQFNGPKELLIINEHGKEVTSVKGLTIKTSLDFVQCPALDYLFIPGGLGTRKEVDNEKIIAFIQDKAPTCQQILSVCTGAFLLQKAGLLHNKKATTHWSSLNRLRAFEDVHVVEERYTRDGNIWTSAGVSAGIDMSLAFIDAIAGAEVAGQIQLFAEYYPSNKIYPTPGHSLPKYI
jgi:transcriptional regulator GlxA family with amidase domain